jgi:hypothetical protein
LLVESLMGEKRYLTPFLRSHGREKVPDTFSSLINQSELAHYGQISSTRMTQIMWLDNLAPEIQEEILFLPRTTQGRDTIKEADLPQIAKTFDWNKQRQMWSRLRQDVTDASSPSQ